MTSAGEDIVTAELLRIMYDPVGYTWRPDNEDHPAGRWVAWHNQALIERHRLACRIDFAIDGEIRWWIEHWSSLRRIAFLIGCRCLRRELAADRRLLHLDAAARRFALLPVVAPQGRDRLAHSGSTNDHSLRAEGFGLLDPFAQHLPLAIRQRLNMLFLDLEPLPPTDTPTPRTRPSYPMLVSTATRYAQAHPH